MYMKKQITLVASALLLSPAAFAITNLGGTSVPSHATQKASNQTDQLIIKFKKTKTKMIQKSMSNIFNEMSQSLGVNLTYVRPMSGDAQVVKLTNKMSSNEIKKLISKIKKDSRVLTVEADTINHIMTIPNDTRYDEQWNYHTPAQSAGGANLPGAWDITTGSSSQVVAVVDTGILHHSDLSGKILPGYDFISDSSIGNDGDGRDADATDPGDSDGSNNSSWHGTHVSGTIAAATNNGTGVAGINWNTKILPVRVLGVGGGYTSDIVDGVRWAAGLSVAGVPDNPTPAKVMNLSLGGSGSCNSTWQNAINDITDAGAIMVVAAGNSNADAVNFSPASCNNVITVAAISSEGGRSYYSNYGSTVEIAAPGGDGYIDSMILSTLDSGTTTANNDNTYANYQGTSMASPHVAGIVSLLTDINGSLTLSSATEILRSTARTFPTATSNDCTNSTCGSGIIDAEAAVKAARDGLPDSTITPINDFNANTFNDLVWHNYLTGAVKIWNMRGTNTTGETSILTTSNTNLVVKAFADFNSDGKADIILHNAVSGMVRIWTMDGTTRLSNNLILASSNTNLHIIGAGDFTGDGNIDLAVHNSVTGSLRIWEMDGHMHRTANISVVSSSNTNLQGVAVGDLNGDDKPDILFHNSTTGNVRVWLMNGTTKASNELVANSSNTNLKVRGILDVDADGQNDIFWQNRSTGAVILWKMNGYTKDGGNIVLGQNTDLSWDIGAGLGGELVVTQVYANSTTPAYLEATTSDWYKLTLSSTQTVTIETLSSIDTYGHLYDALGNQITESDDIDYPSNPNFRITQTLSAGTYFIQVHGFDYGNAIEGSYSLKLY